MKGIAWLLLALGPLLAAPAAAGLWTRTHLAGVQGADFYAMAAAGAALLAEGLLISLRGLVRDLTMLALSAFWAGWAWLGLGQAGYRWGSPPAWRTPDVHGWMTIMAVVLVALAVYGVAGSRRVS